MFRQQAMEMQEQRRFASAVGTKDANTFVSGNLEGEIIQSKPETRPRVAVSQIAHLDSVSHFQPRAHMAK
jgi:hypothetical protein